MCRSLRVPLNLDTVLREVTFCWRGEKPKPVTKDNGLSDGYTATLTRLKAQRGNGLVLVKKVLLWALYLER